MDEIAKMAEEAFDDLIDRWTASKKAKLSLACSDTKAGYNTCRLFGGSGLTAGAGAPPASGMSG